MSEADDTPATKGDLGVLEARLLDRVGSEIDTLEMRMLERLEKTATTLLREFRKWAISFKSKFRASDALVVGFSERVTSLEERVSDLEHRDRP